MPGALGRLSKPTSPCKIISTNRLFATATSQEVGLQLQLMLYVSWCDTLSRFWSFSLGLLSALVAAIVSTDDDKCLA